MKGRWRIVEMELWDDDASNVERDGRPGIEFSWEVTCGARTAAVLIEQREGRTIYATAPRVAACA